MKIAVTYENEQVFQHFGHTSKFKVYDVENNEIVNSEIVDTEGKGHGALATFLKDRNIDSLICGGIGGGAKTALANAGIKLYGCVNGNADDAVNALLSNTLVYNSNITCSHHSDPNHKCHN